MAPEQLLGEPISQRVDIFSFGVAAYELLTNQKPFPGETPAEILKRQLDRSSFLAPREHNPDLPANLEKVILKCIERDPDKRYPFMGMMSRELQAALYV
jgi:serine/threonine-protein kinase